MDTFFLGTHQPHWLASAGVPLFVSDRTLRLRRGLPRAIAPWALDSGAFSEISEHGRWTVTAAEYSSRVRRYRDEIGMMQWAAPQDWMCEPWILQQSGGTVELHQSKTIDSVIELRSMAPDLPWAPVLQGWTVPDYWRHADEYQRRGIDLTAESIVGVGSVCRRQGTSTAGTIMATLAASGIRLHAFGAKTTGLSSYAHRVVSADSLAWSYAARRQPPMAGHTTHINCANCMVFALQWRMDLLDAIERGQRQLSLPEVA